MPLATMQLLEGQLLQRLPQCTVYQVHNIAKVWPGLAQGARGSWQPRNDEIRRALVGAIAVQMFKGRKSQLTAFEARNMVATLVRLPGMARDGGEWAHLQVCRAAAKRQCPWTSCKPLHVGV